MSKPNPSRGGPAKAGFNQLEDTRYCAKIFFSGTTGVLDKIATFFF